MNPLRQILGGLLAVALGVAMFGATTDEAQERETAVKALDRALERFEALVARDDDEKHRAAAQAALGDFKKRRDAVRATFDRQKYDELRVDLNLAYQRQAAWMAPPKNPSPAKPPAKP